MDAKDRQELISDLARSEAEYQMLMATRSNRIIPSDPADAVPYHQLSPQERRKRMERARPANWGTDEQITTQNMLAAQTMGIGISEGVVP